MAKTKKTPAPKCKRCGNDGSKGGLYVTIDARFDPALHGWRLEEREDEGGGELDCLACDHRSAFSAGHRAAPYGGLVFPFDPAVLAFLRECVGTSEEVIADNIGDYSRADLTAHAKNCAAALAFLAKLEA